MKKFWFIMFFVFVFFIGIQNCNALEIGRLTSPTKLNVRSGPGTNYKKYGSLSYNDMVVINSLTKVASTEGCKAGWYLITHNNKTSYVCSSKIIISNHTIRTNNKNAFLYNSIYNKTIYKRNIKNILFTVVDSKKYYTNYCKSGLYKVNYDGKIKYICSDYVNYSNKNSSVITTSDNVIVYSNAKGNHVLGKVSYNTPLTLYDNKSYGKYYKIYYKNKIGFIKKVDVLKTKYISVSNNKDGINVRTKPSSSSKKIMRIKYNKKIAVVSHKKYKGVGCSQGFYKIKYEHNEGYVCSRLLSNAPTVTKAIGNTTIYKNLEEKKTKYKYVKNEPIILETTKKYDGKNCNDGYYKVSINEETAYICSTNTSLEHEKAVKIPIFTFHRIVSDKLKNAKYEKDQWVQSYDIFEQQIKYLYDNNYKTISLDEFYCWYKGNCNFPKKTVVLAFDDGNLDDYYLVMPLLKKYKFKAVTFLVGSRIKDKEEDIYDETKIKYISEDLIKKIKTEYPLHELQSHSYNFHYVDLNRQKHVKNMTKDEIREDFKQNEKYGFKYIAYPYGVYTKDLQEVAKENKYLLGFGFKPYKAAQRTDYQYLISRIKINGFSTVDTLKDYLSY